MTDGSDSLQKRGSILEESDIGEGGLTAFDRNMSVVARDAQVVLAIGLFHPEETVPSDLYVQHSLPHHLAPPF